MLGAPGWAWRASLKLPPPCKCARGRTCVRGLVTQCNEVREGVLPSFGRRRAERARVAALGGKEQQMRLRSSPWYEQREGQKLPGKGERQAGAGWVRSVYPELQATGHPALLCSGAAVQEGVPETAVH